MNYVWKITEAILFSIGVVIGLVIVLLKLILKITLMSIGAALGAVAYMIGRLNCGLEAFLIGLVIWPLWNACVDGALSPYLVGPITYLQAVGLFVLYRIFFGGNNSVVDRTPKVSLSGPEQLLLEALRRSPKGPAQQAGKSFQYSGDGERRAMPVDPARRSPADKGR